MINAYISLSVNMGQLNSHNVFHCFFLKLAYFPLTPGAKVNKKVVKKATQTIFSTIG